MALRSASIIVLAIIVRFVKFTSVTYAVATRKAVPVAIVSKENKQGAFSKNRFAVGRTVFFFSNACILQSTRV